MFVLFVSLTHCTLEVISPTTCLACICWLVAGTANTSRTTVGREPEGLANHTNLMTWAVSAPCPSPRSLNHCPLPRFIHP